MSMSNEEFQNIVIDKLSFLSKRMDRTDEKIDEISKRQDEIYHVVKAIEHSNSVGRSELDGQNIKLSKVEGKIKKAAKIIIEDNEVNDTKTG